ncbi:MAG TPA: hypothetical protein VFZ53_07505 [Polyangiaceae bacterium]
MATPETTVRFEEDGAKLTAVEIVRSGRHPVIVPLYKVLLGLGIVVSTYQVRPSGGSIAERVVLQRRDGQAIDARLSEETKAAILPVVLGEESDAT